MSIYRRVLSYYRPFLGQTIFGLCLALIAIGLNLLKPWPFKIIVDDFLRAGPAIRPDWRFWVLLRCLALVVIQLLWGIINWITNYLFVKIGLQALLKLRTDLYSYLQSLSLKYHDARRSSDSSFRVAYDSQSIQTIYNKGFTNIFGSTITLIGTFVIMLRLDWQLTLISLAIVPLIVGAIYLFAHRIRRESTSIQEQESAVLAQAQEGLSSIRMVHAFGREQFEVMQFHQQARQSLQANLRLTLTNVNSALVISTLMVFGTAAMYYVGTLHVLAGTLTLDGRDVREIKKKSLRAQIGIVLQDTLLFSTTIRENIAYGRPEATDDEIIDAAKRAQADEFIQQLPNGYGSTVGERGGQLSVGQRQRIGIARAFLKNAPVLLLDEPTSALDPATEAAIMETIKELMRGRTTLIATHRLATIHDVDRIVVIERGRIVEQGRGKDRHRLASPLLLECRDRRFRLSSAGTGAANYRCAGSSALFQGSSAAPEIENRPGNNRRERLDLNERGDSERRNHWRQLRG